MGRALARRGIELVYGAGSVGLMGVVADSVLEAGGRAVGVIPRKLARAELMHSDLTDCHVVNSMHERKALMSELSDAFIALPGGFGTFEEVLEVITWSQLGIQQKPIGLLDVSGYYDPFLELVDRGVAEGFIRPRYRKLFVVETEIDTLLDALARQRPLPSAAEDLGIEDT